MTRSPSTHLPFPPGSSSDSVDLLVRLARVGPLLLLILGITIASAGLAPLPGAIDIDDPNALLLEAELIELTEGDVATALERYRGLLERDDLEAGVRARTLFAIARAHRKLGELGAAKERYQELVNDHGDQAALVKAAHRYLAEIEQGAQSLPEFDWVKEVEQSPEIRAQIFEWGMALAGNDDEATAAFSKLLALGGSVRPVLLPMFENSQHGQQKLALADLLVRIGEVSYLPDFLERIRPGQRTWGKIVRVLWSLDKEERNLLVEDFDRILHANESEELRTLLRVTFRQSDPLVEDLRTLRSNSLEFFERYYEDPAGAVAIRSALRELWSIDPDRHIEVLLAFLRAFPARVEWEDLELWEQSIEGYFARLAQLGSSLHQLGRHDELLRLLSGASGTGFVVVNRRRNSRESLILDWDSYNIDVSDDDRAHVYRSTGSSLESLRFALLHPETESHFFAYLDDLGAVLSETGEFPGQIPRWLGVLEGRDDEGESDRDHETVRQRFYDPSFRRSLRERYRLAKTPYAGAVILELLAASTSSGDAESHEFFLGLLESSASLDLAHALLAAVGTLRSVPPAGVNACAAQVLGAATHWEAQPLGSDSIVRSYDGARWVAGRQEDARFVELRVGSMTVHFELESPDFLSSVATVWRSISPGLSELDEFAKLLAGPLPKPTVLLAHRVASSLGPFSNRDKDEVGHDRVPVAVLSSALGRVEDRSARREVLSGSRDVTTLPESVLLEALSDRELSLDVRAELTSEVISKERMDVFEKVDWVSILVGDDPLAPRLVSISSWRSSAYRLGVAGRCLRASHRSVSEWAWTFGNHHASIDDLEFGLQPGSPVNRTALVNGAVTIEHADVLPVLHLLSTSGETHDRVRVIERIAVFAQDSSKAPLRKLLEDPILSIRSAALDALRSIGQTQSERAKWLREPDVPQRPGFHRGDDEGGN